MRSVGSLAGRDAELAVLERTLDALDHGGSLALGVWGEQRIGKSRLLGELAAAQRGVVLARQTRQRLLTPAIICLRGFVDKELGRLDSAKADEEEALDSALISGNVQVAYWASIELSVIALLRGRTEAALEHGQSAWEMLGAREYSQAGFVVADARLAAADPPGAVEALEAFDCVRPQMWTLDRVKAADVAVRVLLAFGRLEEATAVADRVPNAQIALRLDLSERTVEKHVSNLLAKLGLSSSTGVVRLLASAPARMGGAGAARPRMGAGYAVSPIPRAVESRDRGHVTRLDPRSLTQEGVQRCRPSTRSPSPPAFDCRMWSRATRPVSPC
jgi:Bacterial regulatory proteins, luxR family